MGRHKSSVATVVEEFKIRYWALWAMKYDGPCMMRLSMTERRRVVEVLNALGTDEAFSRLGRYFANSDSWLRDNAHPLGIFLKQIDKYRSKKDGKKKIAKAGKRFDEKWEV